MIHEHTWKRLIRTYVIMLKLIGFFSKIVHLWIHEIPSFLARLKCDLYLESEQVALGCGRYLKKCWTKRRHVWRGSYERIGTVAWGRLCSEPHGEMNLTLAGR